MRDFFSFTREDNKRLADAFTAIADVFELVGTRAVPVERTHDTAEPVERDHDTAEPVEVAQSDEELERELGPKPTLPTSASNMYRSSVISDIRKENPGIQRNEAQRLARIRWKNLSEEDRRPFKDRYDARNKQYKIDKAAYAARLKTCMQAESSGSVSTARHAETRSLTPSDRAIERVLGPKPKTPKSISTLYHRDHAKAISALNPDLSYDEVRQLADARWKNVSDEERQQYKDRYRALYRQYKIDIAAYDARVQALISTAYGEPNTPNAVDKVLERELGPKPKPPEAAHHMYRSSVISDIRKENPGIGAKGVEKISDLRWKNLSEEDRRPFKDRHDTLTKQYKIDKAAYDARKVAFLSTSIESVSTAHTTEPGRSTLSISPDPLPQSIEQLNELEATQSDEELERELGPKPKHPTSATNMYRGSVINDIRKENPGINTMEARRLAAIRWKNLSEEDRRPFKDRHDALKKQYKIDKAAYDARETVLVKTSVCKLGESRGNCVANTSDAVQPSQHLASSISPGLPPQPTGCLNGPEYTTTSVSSRFTGLLSSQPLPPPPIESFRSSGAIGSTHPLAISWPAEVTLPDESPSLPANSDGLPRPTMATEHPMSLIQENVAASATLAQPVVPPESIPVGMRPMSLEFPNTTETVAFVESPELSFSTDPPAADVKPSAESAEPAEPLTPTKTKSKKKKKKRATGDDGQSTSPQRKKAKRAKGDAKEGKKKHKPKIVVKTEDNI
ncbi:hypothetical protein GGH94_002620 [Coemansia aciculifera]|uniref:HMG box domain-containing protein n=1 Tax=Coemansia aciculifera TaxID=417176 RepID=A0A9W8M6I7_9FUNG|nr:hypothetical protein GGH94_002620 [Coemansia aciculifera]